MKKTLFLALLILTVFGSCQKEPPYLTLSPRYYEAPVEGGTFTITAETNIEVSYTIDEKGKSWIQGPSGSFRGGDVRFTVSANDIYEARAAQIIFKTVDGSITEFFNISQNGEEDILLEEHSYHIDGKAQTLTVKAKANVAFTAKPQVDWITSASTRGLVNSELNFSIAENRTMSPREGTIELVYQDITRTVTVYQDETECVRIDPQYLATGDAGTIEIPFSTNIQATLEIEAGIDWLSYVETRNETKKTLVLSLTENGSDALRSASLAFRGSEGTILAESKITQLAKGREIVFTVHGSSWQSPLFSGNGHYWITDWGDGYRSPFNTPESHSFTDEGSHTIRIHEYGATGFSISVKGLDVIDLSNF